jgi:hypothetical protein
MKFMCKKIHCINKVYNDNYNLEKHIEKIRRKFVDELKFCLLQYNIKYPNFSKILFFIGQ